MNCVSFVDDFKGAAIFGHRNMSLWSATPCFQKKKNNRGITDSQYIVFQYGTVLFTT